jgi:hypothetical protein
MLRHIAAGQQAAMDSGAGLDGRPAFRKTGVVRHLSHRQAASASSLACRTSGQQLTPSACRAWANSRMPVLSGNGDQGVHEVALRFRNQGQPLA